jgi:ATP-binding cassette subfamily B protein
VQRRVGELVSRITADLAQIQDTLIGTVPHFLRQTILLLGGIALILFTSGQLTLVMLSVFPVVTAVAVYFGRKIRKLAREAQDQLAETNVIVEETLQGIATVKAFANERFELDRYSGSLGRFLTIALKGAKYRGGFVAFIIFALFGAVVLVLWSGARQVQDGTLSVGELTRFMLYTMFVAGAMGSFADLYSQIQRTLGATQRVRELLRETPEPVELVQAPTPRPPLPEAEKGGERSEPTGPSSPPFPPREGGPGGLGLPRLRGEVTFENVGFRYPSRPEVEVLKDVSLRADAGQRIALVGPSGAGKSTLVSLLLRFYDPERGRVLVDGKDVRDYGLTALRGQMAMVPQDVLLFGGTIAENIAYGKPGAAPADIEAAARMANAHDFIVAFPEGYQTVVGERGVKLSGGQRQRVAIARAVLKDPAILILDEATSSLDSESEHLVQQALESLMRGRTSLIIAHRLATVRTADRIYVIKDGMTVESGTHAELTGRENGVYRNLAGLQFGLT